MAEARQPVPAARTAPVRVSREVRSFAETLSTRAFASGAKVFAPMARGAAAWERSIQNCATVPLRKTTIAMACRTIRSTAFVVAAQVTSTPAGHTPDTMAKETATLERRLVSRQATSRPVIGTHARALSGLVRRFAKAAPTKTATDSSTTAVPVLGQGGQTWCACRRGTALTAPK
jgi:hypothetical protein